MAQHQQQPLWWWQRKQQQQQSSSALANPLPGVHLKEWDQGVLVGELINHGLFPRPIQISKTTNLITPADQPKDSDGIRVGTFSGSQKAATEVYSRIEQVRWIPMIMRPRESLPD